MRELNTKEKLFAEHYMQGKSLKECGEIAGYTYQYARKILSRNVTLSKYIENRLEKKQEIELNQEVKYNIATTDQILDYLTNVMNGKINDQFDIPASLQDRTNAAKELLKFQSIVEKNKCSEGAVIIVNNIPKPTD